MLSLPMTASPAQQFSEIPPPPRLELRAVGLRFGAVRALDQVALRVRAGEIVALLGDSGCGKSTLLRVIAGLERPDAGEIRLDGTRIEGVPPEARGVGLMFQDYALFPHLTVGDNVRFGLHDRSRGEAEGIARARLEQVGLAGRKGDYPGTLSGGESQRVALARALAPKPRILLLDEPFSNLDRRTREHVRDDTVRVLRETGTTTILVTHDSEEAMLAADRIALMRAGRIVQTGTADDLYRRPTSRFAAGFFGSLVEIAGTSRTGTVDTPFGRLPAPGFADGAPVLACLRPEAFRIVAPGAGVPGRILARTFLGGTARLTIGVDGHEAPIALTVAGSDAHVPGDRVALTLSGAGGFVFDAGAE